jgi:hypothetical protein
MREVGPCGRTARTLETAGSELQQPGMQHPLGHICQAHYMLMDIYPHSAGRLLQRNQRGCQPTLRAVAWYVCTVWRHVTICLSRSQATEAPTHGLSTNITALREPGLQWCNGTAWRGHHTHASNRSDGSSADGAAASVSLVPLTPVRNYGVGGSLGWGVGSAVRAVGCFIQFDKAGGPTAAHCNQRLTALTVLGRGEP